MQKLVYFVWWDQNNDNLREWRKQRYFIGSAWNTCVFCMLGTKQQRCRNYLGTTLGLIWDQVRSFLYKVVMMLALFLLLTLCFGNLGVSRLWVCPVLDAALIIGSWGEQTFSYFCRGCWALPTPTKDIKVSVCPTFPKSGWQLWCVGLVVPVRYVVL